MFAHDETFGMDGADNTAQHPKYNISIPMLPDPQQRDFRNHLAVFEGRISWMYLDDAVPGNVTAGIGHMIPTGVAAVMVFGPESTAIDWLAVKAASPGMAASAYAHLTTCRLSPEAIDALCDADTADCWARLLRSVPTLPGYPPGVQQALLDLEYDPGVTKFPKMLHAMEVGDWATAARESLRPQLAKSRNDYTAQLILSAQEPVIS